jgi:hypothetical protein
MSNDTEIRVKGMKALIEALGPVDSTRFVSLALREPFDYQKWRIEEFENESLDPLLTKIRHFEKKRQTNEPIS